LGNIKTLEARLSDEVAGFGTSTEQEAELLKLQNDLKNLTSTLHEHYQRRTSILYDNLDIKPNDQVNFKDNQRM
jgi:hypothetical protein